MKKPKLVIICIIWTLAIWTNSILPGEISGAQSGYFTTATHQTLRLIGIHLELELISFVIRKSAHFFQFMVLGLLYMSYFKSISSNASKKHMIYLLLLGLLVACIDETIQLFVPGRAFQLSDIAIDFIGYLAGVCLIMFIQKRSIKKVA